MSDNKQYYVLRRRHHSNGTPLYYMPSYVEYDWGLRRNLAVLFTRQDAYDKAKSLGATVIKLVRKPKQVELTPERVEELGQKLRMVVWRLSPDSFAEHAASEDVCEGYRAGVRYLARELGTVPAECPECPGSNCKARNGEACDLCGAGMGTRAPGSPRCEHDVIERHTSPIAPPAPAAEWTEAQWTEAQWTEAQWEAAIAAHRRALLASGEVSRACLEAAIAAAGSVPAAPRVVTEAQIEAAAKAIHMVLCGTHPPWDAISEADRQDNRLVARAAAKQLMG